MNKLIIGTHYVGLGDHLQFSTLPLLARQYGIECYVSNQNVYRNPEIKKLVWDLNPYIKYTDEAPNVGEYIRATGNIIADWEIKTFAVMKNRQPKLYYQPQFDATLAPKIIIDPNAHASKVDFQSVIDKFKQYEPIILNPVQGEYNTIGCIEHHTKDIFEWVDMIHSAKAFVCQHSAGSVVAAAIGKKADVYLSDQARSEGTFQFDNHYYETI